MAVAVPFSDVESPILAASLTRTVDAISAASPREGAIARMHGPADVQRVALQHAGDELDRRGLKTLAIDPPAGFRDSGPAALVDLASALGRHGLLDGEMQTWGLLRRPWRDRVDDARVWLDRRPADVVLLCHDPTAWGSDDADPFGARAAEAARMMVEQANCRKIVTGDLPGSAIAAFDEILPEYRGLTSNLAMLGDWGLLAGAAGDLLAAGLDPTKASQAQARLLVAHAALLGLDELVTALESPPSVHVLAEDLARGLARAPTRRRLLVSLRRLALPRRPFPEEWVSQLLLGSVDPIEAAALELCLAPVSARGRIVERPLAAAVERHATGLGATDRRRREAERRLFDLYREAHAAAVTSQQPDALVLAVEAFHFAAELGDRDLADQIGPLFAEQLDSFGWTLANEHQRPADAADVYEASLEYEDDAFTHHELAFNLDRLGRRPDDVERHYRTAIRLTPRSPRYHGRLIAFLVVQGAVGDARRQWLEAQAVVTVDETDVEPYELLHLAIAAVALHRAELGLARETLDAVPTWARHQLRQHDLAMRKLDALVLARDGHAFVPLPRLRTEWWTTGPSLLPDRHNGRPRRRWLAARVEEVDDEGVHLRAAVVDGAGPTHPATVATVVALDRFDELSADDVSAHHLARGRFVEVGLFGEGDEDPELTMIRVLREEPWDDAVTPELDTGRYLSVAP